MSWDREEEPAPSDAQLDYLRDLMEKRGIDFESNEPTTMREASEMISEILER